MCIICSRGVCVWGGGATVTVLRNLERLSSQPAPHWSTRTLTNSHPNRVGDAMFHARYVPASMSQVPAFISQNIGLRPIQIGYTTITLFIS